MPVDLKGQQIRIRVIDPSRFSKFKTKDVGRKGFLQIVLGYSKQLGWKTQSLRVNLSDYGSYKQVAKQINKLRISTSLKSQARRKARSYFGVR